jgi:hypothetical protein
MEWSRRGGISRGAHRRGIDLRGLPLYNGREGNIEPVRWGEGGSGDGSERPPALAARLGMSSAGVEYAVKRGEAIAPGNGYKLIQ